MHCFRCLSSKCSYTAILKYFMLVMTVLYCINKATNGAMLAKIRCKLDDQGYKICSCPEDPITERYPDLNDTTCDYYYLCHLGRAMKRKCASNHGFHPKLKECMPRQRIPDNICKPLVKCPFSPNRYMEDKRDCTKYYLCYYGKQSHFTCPEDSYFDPKGEQCVNDKMQAEACVVMAKRNYFKKIEFDEPPPKTSISLDEAKKYVNIQKERQKKKVKG